MAEELKRKFNRGDFLRRNSKKDSFMIYEGNNLSETALKKMSLICFYDPEKYVMGDMGYEQKPHLEVASKDKPCSETIDSEEEDYFIKVCNEAEKKKAMEILAKYGFQWNEQTFELVDIETGEVVRKLLVPDDKYYGQIVRPMGEKMKCIAKDYCAGKNKKYTNSYNASSGYMQYGDYYE